MKNSSIMSSVILELLYKMDDLKYLYFMVFFMLYMFVLFANTTVIFIIITDRALHKPMYVFLCNLAVNGIYGGTALLPALMGTLMSPSHEVSLACCQAQTYFLHTYAIIEFTILSVMCYDRYVAICYPLQNHSIMTITKVYELIAFSWGYPLVAFALFFIMTLRLTICRNIIERVYCSNYSLVKLSCDDTNVVSAIGLFSVVVYTFPQLAMTLYSYGHILKICFTATKKSKIKALKTCMPHLFAILNYSVGCFCEIVQSRFDTSYLPFQTQTVMSLYFLIFPPIVNPVIYGLSVQALRDNMFRPFRSRNKLLPLAVK
ncbi:olfactory receptor 51G2-like [Rhinichthys klamathensis goyatoka]|uniref:olfactory receptor 51G2-like n=1 Tax=Rhinichthys klamathensis goyatoka TaxID=3034132 RepID=UPI0024B5C2A6|nr:olfactory receptor 51G2-like [Rhinichthys klamathensis goyatoka]